MSLEQSCFSGCLRARPVAGEEVEMFTHEVWGMFTLLYFSLSVSAFRVSAKGSAKGLLRIAGSQSSKPLSSLLLTIVKHQHG